MSSFPYLETFVSMTTGQDIFLIPHRNVVKVTRAANQPTNETKRAYVLIKYDTHLRWYKSAFHTGVPLTTASTQDASVTLLLH